MAYCRGNCVTCVTGDETCLTANQSILLKNELGNYHSRLTIFFSPSLWILTLSSLCGQEYWRPSSPSSWYLFSWCPCILLFVFPGSHTFYLHILVIWPSYLRLTCPYQRNRFFRLNCCRFPDTFSLSSFSVIVEHSAPCIIVRFYIIPHTVRPYFVRITLLLPHCSSIHIRRTSSFKCSSFRVTGPSLQPHFLHLLW